MGALESKAAILETSSASFAPWTSLWHSPSQEQLHWGMQEVKPLIWNALQRPLCYGPGFQFSHVQRWDLRKGKRMGGRALTSLMGYSIDGLIIDYWEVVETVGRRGCWGGSESPGCQWEDTTSCVSSQLPFFHPSLFLSPSLTS